MKKSKIVALIIAPLFAAALAMAAADAKVENKAAGCCTKAQAEGKTCSHACCVAAAKEGNNCTKCKGSGKIEKKAEAKK